MVGQPIDAGKPNKAKRASQMLARHIRGYA